MNTQIAASLNFSWLEDQVIAGCAAPMLLEDLDFLHSQGVRALLRLGCADTDDYVIDSSAVTKAGFDDLHLPVEDFHAPTQDQIIEALGFIDEKLKASKPVAVSCGAGCGRTGTILACYLVANGRTPESALNYLIERRPCSREIIERTPQQREAVFEFARLHAAA